MGGPGPALDLDSLAYPELSAVRRELIDRLVRLSADPTEARAALGVSASKDHEIDQNRQLLSAPTLPAIERYTGVLFDAFDVGSLTKLQRQKVHQRVAICSALFGMVRAGDRIPFYRLSAHSKLPDPAAGAIRTVAAQWKPAFGALADSLEELVIDLRSGAYQAFGSFPRAVTVRVVTAGPNGEYVVVSHFNKHTKGLLARALATTRVQVEQPHDVVRVARTAGLRADLVADDLMEIVT